MKTVCICYKQTTVTLADKSYFAAEKEVSIFQQINLPFYGNHCHLNFWDWIVCNVKVRDKLATVLPTISDSDVMFCLQHYQGRIG